MDCICSCRPADRYSYQSFCIIMKRLSLIIICFLTIMSGVSYAQELTNKEIRKINSMILDVVERYEDFAAVYDEDSEYEFLRLFKSKDVPVYAGDLMLGFALDSVSLSAADYARNLLDYADNVAISIRQVKKGKPYIDENQVYIPVAFTKSIEYMDGAVMISSEDFYEQDFNLQLTLVCDRDLKTCKISRITGNIDSDEVFPKKFWVVKKPEETFSKLDLNRMLTSDGKPLQYNEYGYAFVPENSIDNNIIDLKYEVRLKADTLSGTSRHKMLSYDFKKTRGRLKIRNKFAPMSAYKLTDNPEGIKMDSWAYELGVDLGFGVPMGANGRSRFGLFIGAAASLSSINLSHKGFEYGYSLASSHATSSPDQQDRTENKYKFSINSVNEEVKYLDLMVPVYLSFDHSFDRNGRFWLSWNVGVKAYLNTDQKIFKTPVLKVVGKYVEGESQKVVNFEKNFTKFLAPVTYGKKGILGIDEIKGIGSIDISAAANATLNIRCTRSMLVTVGAGYEYGHFPTYSSDNAEYVNEAKGIYPFVYSAEENDVVAAYSMMNSVSFRREALWIDLGLMFKF